MPGPGIAQGESISAGVQPGDLDPHQLAEDGIEKRTRIPEKAALAAAIFGSLGALVLLIWVLAPPVIVMNAALLVAVDAQPAPVVTPTEPLADALPIENAVADSV